MFYLYKMINGIKYYLTNGLEFTRFKFMAGKFSEQDYKDYKDMGIEKEEVGGE